MGKRFPDCSQCRLPQRENERKLWGCDKPSDRPVFEIGCGTCHRKDQSCTRCGGRGVIELYRCPSQTLGEAPPQTRLAVDLLMRCYLQFDGRHVLPVDGGLINQTRSFVSGCEIIDGERGRYEEMKETKREHDKLTAQRKGKVGRHGR